MGNFRKNYDFEQRKNEAVRIRQKYPDRVPIIVEVADGCPFALDKRKFLTPHDLTAGQFMYVLRKRIKLAPEEAIFLFVNGTLPPTAALMGTLYEQHKDKDLFLYCSVQSESTFGMDLYRWSDP